MSEHEEHWQAAAQAIRLLRRHVQWKPRRDTQHLEKRKIMGHLPDEVTMDDYNMRISAVLNDPSSQVYHYPFGSRDYYAVSGEVRNVTWLVIFGVDGILETAFPPDDLTDYLMRRGFVLLGQMGEMVHA
jgi:hypothetical protein